MSDLPEAKDNFSSACHYHYNAANEALEKEMYPDAFRHVKEWAENVLKAILVKNEIFINQPLYRGGDHHHSCEILWEKIKSHNIINSNELDDLEILLPPLFRVNISSQTEHMDSVSSQSDSSRYVDMNKFIDSTFAEEKVNLMNEAFKILEKYLKDC